MSKNTQGSEWLQDFRKRFIRGVGPSWAGTEPVDADSWVEADQEELENYIYGLLVSSNQALLQKVREIVGEDESISTKIGYMTNADGHRYVRNDFRAELHTKLDELENEI